ncbi:MAG: 2-hydroxyacyl-CoA dehydratase [Candidatus Fermentithermobacillus carboniphilus]|uniref:2-hydroxyacyl-CoA dehydratase n=1 Tax=Candidatus Fermentithermobacillus carboniphilus TaxID=3085328 RepID=A0AAT9LAY4_9FIRM|nr:MAG: 2-hydroxyacyl-CoA dehydratase [Candidatus Fermentithermobacillus carboniphilus]
MWPRFFRLHKSPTQGNFPEKALRFLLERGFTYKAVETYLARKSNGQKSYQEVAASGILTELRQAYRRERPVIYTTAFVPTELVYGLGAVPFLPEVWSGFAASLGVAPRAIHISESLGYSQDLCSFHRCGLGLFGMGILPNPSAVIVSSHLCDGGRRSLYYHSRVAGCPLYVLDVPYSFDREARVFLARQIEHVAQDLVRKVPGLSLDHMRRAIEASNGARRVYLDVCRVRRNVPSPWRGSEALNYVSVFLSSWGSGWLPEFYGELLRYLERTVRTCAFPVGNERHRLLWLNLRPYYRTPIFDFLEKQFSTSIAFEEYSKLYWPEIDPDNWAEGLAEKMMSNFGWGPLERRIHAVWSMVEDYSIDGVVQFNQWGCRQSNGGARPLRDFLQKRGIPFLELDGDGVDAGNSGSAQAITRLSAFLEMLDSRGVIA